MVASLFEVHGDGFVATQLSVGPWDPTSLHGGPVAALLARELERWPVDQPMFPARLTVELFKPVGLDPLLVDVRPVRRGRKVQVLEAVLSDAGTGTALARGTLQQIRRGDEPLAEQVAEINGPDPTPTPPSPEELAAVTGALEGDTVRYHTSAVEHRVRGHFLMDPGPATDWIRLVVDLLPGEAPSPLARVAGAADFGNGVSAVFRFGTHLFINPDLTIHLHRLPTDEWVCLDAITRVGDEGVGFAESALFDRRGRIGRSVQSLLIEDLRAQD